MSRDEQFALVATKLRPPRLAQTAIARGALLSRLSSCSSHRVTLISAPAGYGKTTSVCQWLDTIDRPFAWLSLDQHDSHPQNFVRYLIAAIQFALPHAQMTMATSLASVPMLAPHQVADWILRDLADLNSPLVIVLDDYHTIDDIYIHTVIRRLVAQLVPQVHIVISTRADPPLPLVRLRLQGDLADIRSNDLRFSSAEIAQLLEPLVELPEPSRLVDRIGRVTEGWPSGIQLAALSLQQTHSAESLIDWLPEKLDQMYVEYLLDELFREVEPSTQLLLARMAIFERVSAPLIELVRPENYSGPAAEKLIASLWGSNYFLTSLDQNGIWYQFHDLIRSFLLKELTRRQSGETISTLHLQASNWFYQQGLQQEAVEHAFLCGDDSHVIRSAEQAAVAAIQANDWQRLDLLLGTLPAPVTERPLLLLAKAYLHNYQNNYDSVPALLDAATAGLTTPPVKYSPDELRVIDGQIQALRALTAARIGMYEDAIRHAERAEESLPDFMETARGYAGFARNFALIRRGSGDDLRTQIQASLQQLDRCKEPQVLRRLMAFSFALYDDANLWLMRDLVFQLKPAARQIGQPLFLGWVDFWLGWMHYQRNSLAAAAESFSRVIAARDAVHIRAYVESATGMALTLNSLGQVDESKQCVVDLHRFAMRWGMVDLGRIAGSLAVRLSIDINCDEYMPFAPMSIPQVPVSRGHSGMWEWPPATIVRSCLRGTSTHGLAEVDAYLRQCEETEREVRSTRRAIELGMLRARLSHHRGDRQAALGALRTAVARAAPGGTLRLIADDAADLVPYLAELRKAGQAPVYMDALWAAVADGAESQNTPPAKTPQMGHVPGDVPALDEALTFRELEVLSYIQQGQSNKEIAKYLTISPSTVRKHTINIYGKLQVANRTQAAARARQLNLSLPRL